MTEEVHTWMMFDVSDVRGRDRRRWDLVHLEMSMKRRLTWKGGLRPFQRKKNLCFCDDFDAGVPVQERTYVAAMDPYSTGV